MSKLSVAGKICNVAVSLHGDPCEVIQMLHAAMKSSPEIRAVILTAADTYEKWKDSYTIESRIEFNGREHKN